MMMLEEAIAVLAESKRQNEVMRDNPTTFWASHQMADGVKNAERRIAALNLALSAIRPVSRERVEKVWRGEWNQDEHGRVVCNRCGSIAAIGTENVLHNAKKYDRFCFYCGAPMTDEAVEVLMERLEELSNGKG